MYATGQYVRQNDGYSSKVFARSCDLGYTGGCVNAGVQFIQFGIPYDNPEKIMVGVGDACEAGIGRACFLQGTALKNGRGLKQDTNAATQFLARACELGFKPACMLAQQKN